MSFERVLVCLKPQFLGDAVMAMPLIDELSERAKIVTLWIAPSNCALFSSRSKAIDLQPYGKARTLRETLAIARNLRAKRSDAAILVNRSARSAIICCLAGIPVRIGHRTEGRGLLLTHRIPYDAMRFEADCYMDLLRVLEPGIPLRRCQVPLTDDERAEGRSLLAGATVGIQPGASYAGKQYPLSSWIKVASELQSQGATIAALGGPDEKEVGEEFCCSVAGALNLVGRTSIRQTLGALAGLRLFLSADTGVAHFAAAVGCPRVTLFGPQPASKWAHPDSVALQAEGGYVSTIDPAVVVECALGVLRR